MIFTWTKKQWSRIHLGLSRCLELPGAQTPHLNATHLSVGPTRVLRSQNFLQNLVKMSRIMQKMMFPPPDNINLDKILNFASYFALYPSGSFFITVDYRPFKLLARYLYDAWNIGKLNCL